MKPIIKWLNYGQPRSIFLTDFTHSLHINLINLGHNHCSHTRRRAMKIPLIEAELWQRVVALVVTLGGEP
jgi:hypothetical protein